jgi:hypothetical protein
VSFTAGTHPRGGGAKKTTAMSGTYVRQSSSSASASESCGDNPKEAPSVLTLILFITAFVLFLLAAFARGTWAKGWYLPLGLAIWVFTIHLLPLIHLG